MRKIISVLLCVIVVVMSLASCGKDNQSTKDQSTKEQLPDGIDNPSSEYVVMCLKKIPLITGIEAVTERNDPNGNLNKQGGYTAQVFFSYALVDQTEFEEDTVIDKGTDCGGSVEVYATEKDAQKRDQYLSTFDATPLATGSHKVVGTVIVRTSNKLTASQQRSLEYDIIAALKGEDDKINKTNAYEMDFVILKTTSEQEALAPSSARVYLEEKKYTNAEINYIIDNCGVDWKTEARQRVQKYVTAGHGVSKNKLDELLTNEGYKKEDIEYGKAYINWVDEAMEILTNMCGDYTKEQVLEWGYYDTLYDTLVESGYTQSEADRAMESFFGQ